MSEIRDYNEQTIFNDTDWMILQEASGSYENKKFTFDRIRDKIKADTIVDVPSSSGECQTVLSGPVDASGYANFLSKDGANNNVKLSSTTTPVYIAFANGFSDYGEKNYIVKISADTVPSDWSSLTTNGTYYLYADLNTSTLAITYGKTNSTVNPVYVYSRPAFGTATKHAYVIPERKMYSDSGSAWSEVVRVFLGHVVVSGSAVSSVVTYAYNGKYVIESSTVVAGTTYTHNHNIGTDNISHRMYIANASFGWTDPRHVYTSADIGQISGNVTATSVQFRSNSDLYGAWTDGSVSLITKYKIVCERAF